MAASTSHSMPLCDCWKRRKSAPTLSLMSPGMRMLLAVDWMICKAWPMLTSGARLKLRSIVVYWFSWVISEGARPGSCRVKAVIGTIVPLLDFTRSEEHTSELQSLAYLVCRLLLEKK